MSIRSNVAQASAEFGSVGKKAFEITRNIGIAWIAEEYAIYPGGTPQERFIGVTNQAYAVFGGNEDLVNDWYHWVHENWHRIIE